MYLRFDVGVPAYPATAKNRNGAGDLLSFSSSFSSRGGSFEETASGGPGREEEGEV